MTTSISMEMGDLDGDGDLGAFVGNGGPPMGGAPNHVYLNDGAAGFTNSGQNLGNLNSTGLGFGDLDGDGDLDAFVGNRDNQPRSGSMTAPASLRTAGNGGAVPSPWSLI